MKKCVFLSFVVLVCSGVYAQEGEPQAAWKHQIGFPDDPFQSWTTPPYIKFTIITKAGYDPNLVYYQDSSQYEYHFDFALGHLEPFVGMTLEEFDRVTLHASGQQAVLGAAILPPWHDPPFAEYGIQFTRLDPYTRDEIVHYFNLVKTTVLADPNVKAYYFPTYEQYLVAQQNREWFEARGVPVGSTAQWSEGNASYAQGWALGALKFVPGSEIQHAYTAGELSPDDILLTDGVPADRSSSCWLRAERAYPFSSDGDRDALESFTASSEQSCCLSPWARAQRSSAGWHRRETTRCWKPLWLASATPQFSWTRPTLQSPVPMRLSRSSMGAAQTVVARSMVKRWTS